MFSEQQLPLESNEFQLNVVGGNKDSVKCKTKTIKKGMLKGSSDKITNQINLDHFLYSPVAENVKVGSVKYYYKDELVFEEPIYTAENVKALQPKEKGFFEKLLDKLKICFA